MATLIEKIREDKWSNDHQIAMLKSEIANQENDIRQIAAKAAAAELIRLLPDKLKDLEVRLQWLHEAQEKQSTLAYYLKGE